jgi:3-deoxy-D-manno-octulosonate 8-phosphate phosphatase (KDO 8-P phosphatase)
MTSTLTDDARARLARVKLLVLDVDGVLTDGSLYYTEHGEEIKKFHVRDGQGIKLAQQAGIEVALVSGNASTAVEQRARVLGVPYVFLGVADKLATLEVLCTRLGLSLAQVAYVGDDVNDLSALHAVGCPCTVADAMPANRACAVYVTHLPGGQGAVREICDVLIQLHTPSARLT